MKINLSAKHQYNLNVKEFSTCLLLIAASVASVAFGCMTGFIPAICVGMGIGLVGLVALVGSFRSTHRKEQEADPSKITHFSPTSVFKKAMCGIN